MKRVFLLMTTILLMAAASGCMQTPQEEAPPEQEPEQSQPLHLTSLSIELQRDGQNAQQLLDARQDSAPGAADRPGLLRCHSGRDYHDGGIFSHGYRAGPGIRQH